MCLPAASIVIPTLDRPQELDACLTSLKAQGCQDYEVILLTERGPLARLRNQGLAQARAPVVCFIDDDVVCSRTWLSRLLGIFRESSEVVGITGPAIIPEEFKSNRDLFRHRKLLGLYTKCFVSPETRPGHITAAGTFVPNPDYTYCGYVQFLEACNMSFRTEAIKAVGGFNETYLGIGDWSEPDLCFRMRCAYGDRSLWFSPNVRVEHHPSRTGAYLLRAADARQRLRNYGTFASRWVAPTLRHNLYRAFLWSYYTLWRGGR